MYTHNFFDNGYSFDDLTIIPRMTPYEAKNVDLKSNLFPELIVKSPFISAPMDTVTDSSVAIKLAQNGALGILHYNYQTQEERIREIQKVKNEKICDPSKAAERNGKLALGVLIKCEDDEIEFVQDLIKLDVDFIALDSLHNKPEQHLNIIKKIKKKFSSIRIMSGNVVHPQDCRELITQGVDMIRVGYSAASVNFGKSIFGTGRSQANSIYECAKIIKYSNTVLIADGGMKSTGDIAIAFALGADFIMLGKLFACGYDTPGEIIIENDRKFKIYKGMSRAGLLSNGLIPEGGVIKIEAKSSIIELLTDMESKLRLSIARTGNNNLKDFSKNSELQLMTQSSIKEIGFEGNK